MDEPTDAYAELLDAIDTRLRALPQPPSESDDADDPDDLDARRSRLAGLRLQADRLEAELHSRVTSQPVTYGEAAFCAECGDPAPCPTIRTLLTTYAETGG